MLYEMINKYRRFIARFTVSCFILNLISCMPVSCGIQGIGRDNASNYSSSKSSNSVNMLSDGDVKFVDDIDDICDDTSIDLSNVMSYADLIEKEGSGLVKHIVLYMLRMAKIKKISSFVKYNSLASRTFCFLNSYDPCGNLYFKNMPDTLSHQLYKLVFDQYNDIINEHARLVFKALHSGTPILYKNYSDKRRKLNDVQNNHGHDGNILEIVFTTDTYDDCCKKGPHDICKCVQFNIKIVDIANKRIDITVEFFDIERSKIVEGDCCVNGELDNVSYCKKSGNSARTDFVNSDYYQAIEYLMEMNKIIDHNETEDRDIKQQENAILLAKKWLEIERRAYRMVSDLVDEEDFDRLRCMVEQIATKKLISFDYAEFNRLSRKIFTYVKKSSKKVDADKKQDDNKYKQDTEEKKIDIQMQKKVNDSSSNTNIDMGVNDFKKIVSLLCGKVVTNISQKERTSIKEKIKEMAGNLLSENKIKYSESQLTKSLASVFDSFNIGKGGNVKVTAQITQEQLVILLEILKCSGYDIKYTYSKQNKAEGYTITSMAYNKQKHTISVFIDNEYIESITFENGINVSSDNNGQVTISINTKDTNNKQGEITVVATKVHQDQQGVNKESPVGQYKEDREDMKPGGKYVSSVNTKQEMEDAGIMF